MIKPFTASIILLVVVSITLPLVYAKKVLDWGPSHQSGNEVQNPFMSFSLQTANIALETKAHFSGKNDIAPYDNSVVPLVPTPALEEFKAPQKPYRFLLVGDSSVAVSGGFGDVLEQKLINYTDTHVLRDGKVSSGLSRPDYFNWNNQAAADVSTFAPNIVVVMIGDNDAQGFSAFVDGRKQDVAYGTVPWDSEYSKRVQDFAAVLTSHSAVMYWVGLPAMRDAGFAQRIRHVNSLAEQALKSNGLVKFISGEELMAGQKAYEPFLPDAQGVMHATRNSDGIHLSYFGNTILADKVIEKLKQDIELVIKP